MVEQARTPVASPAFYPLGSVESRAAARAMREWKHSTRKRVEYVSCIPSGRHDSRIRFGPWQERRDGTLFRYVYVPHVWVKIPIEGAPSCLDCGAAYEQTKESGGMMGFQPNCVARHDPDNRTQLSKRSALNVPLATASV